MTRYQIYEYNSVGIRFLESYTDRAVALDRVRELHDANVQDQLDDPSGGAPPRYFAIMPSTGD